LITSPARFSFATIARRAFIVWEQARLFELWRLWDATIREVNPNAAFLANAGGGALSPLDWSGIPAPAQDPGIRGQGTGCLGVAQNRRQGWSSSVPATP
jgi:hypothetical protein